MTQHARTFEELLEKWELCIPGSLSRELTTALHEVWQCAETHSHEASHFKALAEHVGLIETAIRDRCDGGVIPWEAVRPGLGRKSRVRFWRSMTRATHAVKDEQEALLTLSVNFLRLVQLIEDAHPESAADLQQRFTAYRALARKCSEIRAFLWGQGLFLPDEVYRAVERFQAQSANLASGYRNPPSSDYLRQLSDSIDTIRTLLRKSLRGDARWRLCLNVPGRRKPAPDQMGRCTSPTRPTAYRNPRIRNSTSTGSTDSTRTAR